MQFRRNFTVRRAPVTKQFSVRIVIVDDHEHCAARQTSSRAIQQFELVGEASSGAGWKLRRAEPDVDAHGILMRTWTHRRPRAIRNQHPPCRF